MANYEFRATRLFVCDDLASNTSIMCTDKQTHYLMSVLRLKADDEIFVFNGRHGEWRARIVRAGKKSCQLLIMDRLRGHVEGPDIDYLFAPLKRSRLDYMVQKAVEMGVARLRPVITQYTNVRRINLERMRANVIEAAEQCGILRLPEVLEPAPLEAVLGSWREGRLLIFCDEDGSSADPIAQLSELEKQPLAVLIGPEGGFSPEEREKLRDRVDVIAITLGPRIMRADTAAVAALALVNSVLGDWRAD